MLTKKYYDGFIVHDILEKHLEPGKMLEVLTAFAEAKGVDAVEVIRCKDCKYYEEQDETIGTCLLTENGAHITGYCSWAEVKDDETD